MAGNHGFADGNKRTALLLVDALLVRSGYDLRPASPAEAIDAAAEQMILDSVTGATDFDGLCDWFRARIHKR
jgi:death on curing protein